MTLGNRNPRTMLPKMPPWVRYAIASVVVGAFAYAFTLLDRVEQAEDVPDQVLEKVVAVPILDDEQLRATSDATTGDRLQVEAVPLKHLLAKSIDVGPSVAVALQIPAEMVPTEELRENPDQWRYRWLWYEGQLTQLSAPRKGHPIKGYSIYEATILLEDGNSVIAAFSVEPKEKREVGDWVRCEGYFFKLRDVTYPTSLDRAPMLVGRTLQRDYEDWPKVTEIDQSLFKDFDDSSFWPDDLPMRTAEEDQTEILWHLGAYVRDTHGQRSFADWRRIEVLSSAEPYERLVAGTVERGEPMRVFGTLIRRRTIAAPANPANINFWTSVWVQVRGFGGHLVPVWVPKQVGELPMHAQLEVRGFYYRWFVYDAENGQRYRVPLFIAADLDVFELDTGKTMIEIGGWLGSLLIIMLVLIIWSQRRSARTALEHGRHMDARRRKRRELATKTAAATHTTGSADDTASTP